MGNNEKKFKKKKERERRVRKEVLAKREQTRREAKEKRLWDKEEEANRPKARPIRNEEFRKAQELRDAEIRLQLEHNLQILKALEEEYQAELQKREDYMRQLKEQNALTPENSLKPVD